MSFTITITETREVRKLAGKEWAKLGTNEIARDEMFYRASDDEPKTRLTDVMGYTPEIEKTVTEQREVLRQIVDELDLHAVIRAVNKLP